MLFLCVFFYIEGDMDVDDPLEESKMETDILFSPQTSIVS
jgi:hypothetical protein